jgi:hypothetical protein
MDYTYNIKRSSFGWILLIVGVPCIYMGCGLKSKGEIIVQPWKDCLNKEFRNVVKLKNNSSEEVIVFNVLNKTTNTTSKHVLFPGDSEILEKCTKNEFEIVGAIKR